jgi:hypothetical protein
MGPELTADLSRRERQIMDVLFAMRQATVTDVLERIPDPPSYSAVRATMRVLEEKGHVEHLQDGPRYLYKPVVAQESARSAGSSPSASPSSPPSSASRSPGGPTRSHPPKPPRPATRRPTTRRPRPRRAAK